METTVIAQGQVDVTVRPSEPPPPVDRTPRTCATCAHRIGGFGNGKCAFSGYYLEVERKYPTICGRNFEGWKKRQGIFVRIRDWWLAA